jgi:N,N-dimethylformamidase
VLECRKFGMGWKAWEARPGEHYMATNGHKGACWRARNRAPNKIVGVGFVAEGFAASMPFRRMPDSYEPSLSWVTEGIEKKVFGDFGLAHDGAAGLELDAHDFELGTPPNTKVVAASGGHDDNYLLMILPHEHEGIYGSYDGRIRAEMTHFDAPNGGAVFSFSSIAFGQSLPINNFDNDISRLLANVVDRYLKPGPVHETPTNGEFAQHAREETTYLEPASSEI